MSIDVSKVHPASFQFQFDEFVIDVSDRQLWRRNERIDLNPRYLDALILLVREQGRLVEKTRFFEEVWRDMVVTDSALTQCIKEIRRQLGDSATNPRFVQTVPRSGYRFIAEVTRIEKRAPTATSSTTAILPRTESPRNNAYSKSDATNPWRGVLLEWGAGTAGGGAAGLFGGMLYGFGLANPDAGIGTLSTLLVLVGLNVIVGLTGGLGVSLGMAVARFVGGPMSTARIVLRIMGAAMGGLFIGALAKFLGMDAFNLLFGRAPAGITGGPEGAILGVALATGAYLGLILGNRSNRQSLWFPTLGAGLTGAIAGAVIPIAGGRLMGGSLELLAASFADSRLQFDTFSSLFGEIRFGLATQAVLGAFEGFLFGCCVVGAIVWITQLRNDRNTSWQL